MVLFKSRVLRAVLFIACALFTCALYASQSLTTQIKTELEDELYPLSSVLSGYKRPSTAAPKFAVADFRVSKDELHNRSKAISEILRYHLQYVPGVRLYMPASYSTYEDSQLKMNGKGSQVLLTSRGAFKGLNSALGIETVLTGKLDINGTQHIISAELVEALSGKVILKREWTFLKKELSKTLISLSEWVFVSLGVELTHSEQAYLKNRNILDQKALESFISHYSELINLKGPVKREQINKLQSEHPQLVVLAIYALHNRAYADNLDKAYKNLEFYKRMRLQNAGNAGVALESYRMMEIGSLPKHEVAKRLSAMKDLVIANQVDPTILINYAEGLVHNGSSLDGIVILLEGVDRWPQNYRVWWSLGWALNQHSWQVRGHSKWRDVPELAKDKFKIMSHLADGAIDKALEINARNGVLWSQKIRTMGSLNGYSAELMQIFDMAVKLIPTEKRIYDVTWNYASNKWGGNVSSRRHVADLAIKHNPNAGWPIVMQNYIKLNDDVNTKVINNEPNNLKEIKLDLRQIKEIVNAYVGGSDLWKIIALIIVVIVILWTMFSLGKQSAENEAIRKDRK